MQRPFAKPFGLAEPLLGKFRGHAFSAGVDFHGALADFDLSAVIAEHIFHEADDKVRHGPLSCETIRNYVREKGARRAPNCCHERQSSRYGAYAAFCRLGRMSAPLGLADPLRLCG